MSRRFYIFLALLIGGGGVLLAQIGWQWKMPTYDHLNNIYDSIAFLNDGAIPVKGNVTSKGSFSPPGNTWLYIPGVAFLKNVSLYESFGSGLLYIGSILGLFLTASRYGGNLSGLFASVIFAFSKSGHFFADSLLAIGNPFFTIWMLYFICRWVDERDGKFLAGAFFMWGLGMYVFLTIAPAIFIFPVLWFVFRAPVRFSSLAAAAGALLIIWLPYLTFDYEHGFSNILSQVSQTNIVPDNFERTWNDPSLRSFFEKQTGGLDLAGKDAEIPIDSISIAFKLFAIKAAGKISNVGVALTHNFKITTGNLIVNYIIEVILAIVVIVSILASFKDKYFDLVNGLSKRMAILFSRNGALIAGASLISASAVSNEYFLRILISKDNYLWPNEISIIRQFQLVLFVIGVAVLFNKKLQSSLKTILEKCDINQDARTRLFLRVVSISYLVPLILLIFLAEPGTPRRFEWLWPFQSLILSVFAIHSLPSLLPGAAWRRAALSAILLLLLWRPLFDGASSFMLNGFSGKPRFIVQALESISDTLRKEKRTETTLGYHIPFSGYQASFNIIDPRYKVGAVYDLILSSKFGITNLDKSAEGFMPGDEFRIVGTKPKGKSMRSYSPLPDGGYRQIGSFGPFLVLRRLQKRPDRRPPN